MRRPPNGVYLIRSLSPPYQVWAMWRGRIIAGGFARTHADAQAQAEGLKQQLAALPVFDQTGEQEDEQEERRAA